MFAHNNIYKHTQCKCCIAFVVLCYARWLLARRQQQKTLTFNGHNIHTAPFRCVQKRCNMCPAHTHTLIRELCVAKTIGVCLSTTAAAVVVIAFRYYVSVLIESLGLFHSYDSIYAREYVYVCVYYCWYREIGFASNFMSFAVAVLVALCACMLWYNHCYVCAFCRTNEGESKSYCYCQYNIFSSLLLHMFRFGFGFGLAWLGLGFVSVCSVDLVLFRVHVKRIKGGDSEKIVSSISTEFD